MSTRDASDWLSPVLVKEMRQGLKGKAFVGAFLLLHASMFMGMATALLQPSPLAMRELSTGLFWMVTVVSLLAFVPGLAVNALAAEMKAKTFELMILTRLSAWRIVVGKWSSIVAQAGLLVSSLLPYLVVRYFVGGVDILQELLVLIALSAFSMFLVALAIFGSTFKGQLVRLVMLGILGTALMTATGLGAAIGRGGSGLPAGAATTPVLALLVVGVGVILLPYFMLQAASTRVGPLVENHAAAKRAVGLVLLGMAFLPLPNDFREAMAAVLVPVLALICLDACSERRSHLPSTYLPYAKWPRGLRAFGALLYPGWPSAILYSSVLSVGLGLLLSMVTDFDLVRMIVFSLSFFATIVMPMGVAVAVGKPEFVGAIAIAIHLVMLLTAVVMSEVSSLFGSGWQSETAGAMFPASALAVMVDERSPEVAVTAAIAMLVWLVLSGILLAWRGRKDLRSVNEAFQRAVAS